MSPDAAQDYSSLWKHSIEEDGWYRAHNALRYQLKAVGGMLSTFQLQVGAGKAISREQAAAATRFLAAFARFFHHHHANEEGVANPYMSTRFEVAKEVAADHKRLHDLLEAFKEKTKKLLASSSVDEQRSLLQAVAGVQDVYGELNTVCLAHLKEEEERDIPQMRKHFMPKEIEKNVVAKILRTMQPDDVGVFVKPLSKDEFRGFARQEGIPFFIRWLLGWQAAKYERNVWRPFEQQCLTAAA